MQPLIQAQIGEDLGASDWKLIDQPLIDRFADLTEDRQFIHLDQAAATPLFGGTIAHGFLTLSLLPALKPPTLPALAGATMTINYGFNKIRFLQPVRSGKRIRARHVLRDVEQRAPGQMLVTTEVTVEIEGETKPALVAEWLGLYVL